MAGGERISPAVEKAVHGGDVWSFYPVIDFSSNVNPLGPPDKVLKAVRESLWKVSYYPDDRGSEIRRAIAEYTEAEEDHLVIGNGSTEIIKTFAEAFIGRGDRVVIPSPTYSEYKYQALVRGAEVELVQPDNGFCFNPEAIAEALEAKPRAVFLCDPNNPTGRSLGKKALRRLVEAAWERGVLVFLDEAYVEFSGRSSLKQPWEYENLMVSHSLTKLYTLPGLRLGYGVAGEEIMKPMERLRIPWNVNVLAQAAGVEALKDMEFVETTRKFLAKERKFLQRGLRAAGLEPMPTETNFFLVKLRGRIPSPMLKKRLLERGILVRDCSSFYGLGKDYIRVAVRLRDENQRLINELKELMEGPMVDCRYYPCHFKGQDCTWCYCPFYPCLDPSTGGKYKERKEKGRVWSCINCHWVHREKIARAVKASMEGKQLGREELLKLREELLGDEHG